MNPEQLLTYLFALCRDPAKTSTQIKAALDAVKASALVNPDSPARRHDLAYYCDRIKAVITELETTVPPHSSDRIKELLVGRAISFLRLDAR